MGFPGTPILDTFTGTNGDDLPVYSANWQTITTALEIQSNAATTTVDGTLGRGKWVGNTFAPDSQAFCTLSTNPADGRLAEIVLWDGSNNGYTVRLSKVAGASNDTVAIRRYDSGLSTLLGATITQEFADGDGLGIERIGDDIVAYRNSGGWASLGTRTDATYHISPAPTIVTNSTTTKIDDFGARNIASNTRAAPLGMEIGMGWRM